MLITREAAHMKVILKSQDQVFNHLLNLQIWYENSDFGRENMEG